MSRSSITKPLKTGAKPASKRPAGRPKKSASAKAPAAPNRLKASANRAMKPATETQANRHSDKPKTAVSMDGVKMHHTQGFAPIGAPTVSAKMLNDAYAEAIALSKQANETHQRAINHLKEAKEILAQAQSVDAQTTVRANAANRSLVQRLLRKVGR